MIEWQPKDDVSREHVKLVFLLLQCFETAMPWGGKITVPQIADQWAVYGQAEQMKFDTEMWEVLSRPTSELKLDAAHVHFALAPLTASSINRHLTLECSDNSARVRF